MRMSPGLTWTEVGRVALLFGMMVLGCSAGSAQPDGGNGTVGGDDAGQNDAGHHSDAGSQSDAGTQTGNGSICQEVCTQDADCFVGGSDVGLSCSEGRCRRLDPACVNDALCTAQGSNWGITSCTDDSQCTGLSPAARCVDLDGTGPGTAGGCAEDATNGCQFRTEVTAVAIGGGNIQVCGTLHLCNSTTSKCDRAPCADNSDCSGLFDKCDVARGKCVVCFVDADCAGGAFTKCTPTGICGCAGDSQCTGTFTKCSATGQCGCAGDSQCANSLLGNVCNLTTNVCGCADASSCTQSQYDGTTHACVKY